MKRPLAFLALAFLVSSGYSWDWFSPYTLKNVNFENGTKQIQFTVSNPANSSDPALGYTFIYDCDQSGNSYDAGKVIQSLLLSAMATGLQIGFDTQNISGSTTIWEVKQVKIMNN